MQELIDRNSAIDKMCSDCKSGYDGHCPHPFGICHELESLFSVPTIDAETVRHGQWKKVTELEWNTEYSCSLCNHKTHMHVMPDQRDNWIDNYCGGCGAKMDGGNEND